MAVSGEENYVETGADSLPETMVLHSNEETTEDADDAAINNGAVEAMPHIPTGLEVAEAMVPETTAPTTPTPTTTTTTEPTTTTVATSTVPMSKCRRLSLSVSLSGAVCVSANEPMNLDTG